MGIHESITLGNSVCFRNDVRSTYFLLSFNVYYLAVPVTVSWAVSGELLSVWCSKLGSITRYLVEGPCMVHLPTFTILWCKLKKQKNNQTCGQIVGIPMYPWGIPDLYVSCQVHPTNSGNFLGLFDPSVSGPRCGIGQILGRLMGYTSNIQTETHTDMTILLDTYIHLFKALALFNPHIMIVINIMSNRYYASLLA